MLRQALSQPLAMRVLVLPLTAVVLVGCSNVPSRQDTNQADWVKYYKKIDEPREDN
jgi:uncharacterized protein YceK